MLAPAPDEKGPGAVRIGRPFTHHVGVESCQGPSFVKVDHAVPTGLLLHSTWVIEPLADGHPALAVGDVLQPQPQELHSSGWREPGRPNLAILAEQVELLQIVSVGPDGVRRVRPHRQQPQELLDFNHRLAGRIDKPSLGLARCRIGHLHHSHDWNPTHAMRYIQSPGGANCPENFVAWPAGNAAAQDPDERHRV